MNIILSIERLILDGLPLAQRQRPVLQAALEAELARLLATDGLAYDLCTQGMYPRIAAGDVQVQDNMDARLLGQQIAQAIYKGIGQ